MNKGVSAIADRAAPPEGRSPQAVSGTASISNAGVEPLIYALLQDAKLIGCAPREQLAPHIAWLHEAQDEIACAIQKAERALA